MEELKKQLESGVDKDGNPLTAEQKAELQKSYDSKEDGIYNQLVEKYKKEHPDATPEEIAAGVKEANPSFGALIDSVNKRKAEAEKTETEKTGEEEKTKTANTSKDDDDDDGDARPMAKSNSGKDKGKKGDNPLHVAPEQAMANVMGVINGAMKGEGSAMAVAFGFMTWLIVGGAKIAKNKIEKHKEDKEELEERMADARRSFGSAIEGKFKDDPMNDTTMALFYDENGNPRSADDLKKSFGNIDPNIMAKYTEAAEKYSKTEDFKNAQAYNEAISKLDPKDKAELDAYNIDQAKLHMANASLAQQNALISEMEKEIAKVESAGSKLDKSYIKALKRDLENKKKQRDKIAEEVKTHQAAIDKRKDAITRIANANKETIPQLKDFQTSDLTSVALDENHKKLLEKLEKGTNESGVPLTDEEKDALKKEIEKSEDDIRAKAVEIFKKDNPDFQGSEEEMMKKIQDANKDNEVVSKALENSLTRNPVTTTTTTTTTTTGGEDEIKKMKDEWNSLNDQLKSGKDKDGNDLTDEQKEQLQKDADALQDKTIDTLADNYKKDHPDASDDEVQAEIRKQHPDIVPKTDEVPGKDGTKIKVQHKLGPRGGKYYRTKGPDSTKWSEWQSGDYKKDL